MSQPKKRYRKKVTMYVVARSGQKGRPTCQHRVTDPNLRLTACGLDLTGWSRQYMEQRLDAILCRRARCQEQA